jgi:hypothetical protein
MPLLSRWMVKFALAYLALGFTLGGLLLANKGVPIHPLLWRLLPAHQEFLINGWMVHLALGVAFWILPRFAQEPKRGNIQLAWIGWVLLNLGIWGISLSPYLPGWAWMPILGRLFQAGGGLVFALYAWPRVKPSGS